MSGRCYSCATGFGFFNKELGCKNCGFAFCKNCLKKKVPVPKHKNEVHKVCNSCHDILTGKVDPAKKASYSPPEAYKKRIAALNNPQPTQPRPATGGAPNPKKYYPKTMTKEDIAIAERLEKLKESRKPVNLPDEKEIQRRLDNIKKPALPPPARTENGAASDTQPATSTPQHPPQGPPPTGQPQPPHMGSAAVGAGGSGAAVDEVHRLMTRYTELVNIDQKYTPESGAPSVPHTSHHQAPYHGDPLVNAANMQSMAGTQEELAALMEATAREAELDAERAMFGDTKDTELRARLNKLKGEDPNAQPGDQFAAAMAGDSDDEEESEEVAAERLIKKMMLDMKQIEKDGGANGTDKTPAEAKKEDSELDAMASMLKKMQAMAKMEAEEKGDSSATKKKKGGPKEEESETEIMNRMLKKMKAMREEDVGEPSARETQAVLDRLEDAPESDPEDQLPWCCMCNNDATLRCYGCDGDLYCQRCYKEGHDRQDYADHRTKKFAPKTGSPDTSY